jgi:hypothetical protein
MRRWITISIVVFSIILASTVQAGGFFDKLYFIGLWQGVDFSDGSEAQRSITLNSDGTFNIIGQEPYTSGCGEDRGMITGTGVFDGGVIITDDFMLTCFNGNGPFGPGKATYTPDKRNGTLIESFPVPSEFPPTTFHKISNR